MLGNCFELLFITRNAKQETRSIHGVRVSGNRIISEKSSKTLLASVIDTTDPGAQYALTDGCVEAWSTS